MFSANLVRFSGYFLLINSNNSMNLENDIKLIIFSKSMRTGTGFGEGPGFSGPSRSSPGFGPVSGLRI